MKKILALLLCALMLISLCACGGNTAPAKKSGEFRIGFGKVDITPTQPIHMESYTDPAVHISEGNLSPLYAIAIVMTDDDDNTMVMVTTDQSWGKNSMLTDLRPLVQERFGIDGSHMVLGGTHNHNAPAYGYSDAYDLQWKGIFQQGVLDAIGQAMDDRAPATIQIGRTETENLTFVRRYHLADGGMTGDNFNFEHNSTITAHESEADEQIQMVRFVRDGDHKDIVMVNWQSHAAKQGNTNFLSSDYVGAIRDKVEAELDVHCIYYQGACGNLNPVSRIEGECPTGDRSFELAVKHGEMVAQYVIDALNTEGLMQQIKSGKINNYQDKFIAEQTWAETNVVTVGELSFVTLPAEFFDSLGMMIKEGTPYKMTVLMGYTCGGDGRYLADERGFANGGYEVNNSLFRRGDGERFVQYYLDALAQAYQQENP